jgi:succinyl-CoA synthetase alpha subunit
MAILIDETTTVVVHGLTGKEGSFHSLRNRDYGTRVVAGMTPGKGGQDVDGIPVFDTAAAAVEATGANTSLIFVPARFAADAILEAQEAGVRLAVCITEGVPVDDMARVHSYLQGKDMTLVGPNCPGLISPGKSNVGIIPGEICAPGSVGLVSRSGTLTYQIVHELSQRGVGQSTCLGIGGDPVHGVDRRDRTHRVDRRDRRRRGRACCGIRPRARDQTGGRLHRRVHRASRQADGSRWGDRDRLQRDRAGEG